MKKFIPTLLAGTLLIGLAGSATAGTATTNFRTMVTVDQTCTISGWPIDFGPLDTIIDDGPAGGLVSMQTQTSITLNCTDATPITVSVQGENGNAGRDGTFQMVDESGSYNLNYRVTQDAAYQTPWGTIDTGTALAMNSIVGTQVIPMYSEILGTDNQGEPVRVGNYSDTLTVSVVF